MPNRDKIVEDNPSIPEELLDFTLALHSLMDLGEHVNFSAEEFFNYSAGATSVQQAIISYFNRLEQNTTSVAVTVPPPKKG